MSLLPIFEPEGGQEPPEVAISDQPKRRGSPVGTEEASSSSSATADAAAARQSLLQEQIKHMESPYKDTTIPGPAPPPGQETTTVLQDGKKMKFRSPREDCSPEDCCCCLYFMYLLFNQEIKPPAYEANPAVGGIRALAARGSGSKSRARDATDSARTPGYSYFKNISTGSSIDSKSSWFDRYCGGSGSGGGREQRARDLLQQSDDDESDGWMVGHAAAAAASNRNGSEVGGKDGTAASGASKGSTSSSDNNDHAPETIIDLTPPDTDPVLSNAHILPSPSPPPATDPLPLTPSQARSSLLLDLEDSSRFD